MAEPSEPQPEPANTETQKPPYGSANRSLVEHIDAMPAPGGKDCLSCRIVGSGTFAGVGTYALWQSRAAAPGSLGQKRIVAGLGIGKSNCYTRKPNILTCPWAALLTGSVIRWYQCKSPSIQRPSPNLICASEMGSSQFAMMLCNRRKRQPYTTVT